MSVQLPKHLYQIRFLLHGCSEHYSNLEPLYLTSERNSVWGRIAYKVLDEWKMISPVLAERIPPGLWNEFKIQEISPSNLIADLPLSSLTQEDLPNAVDRKEVLARISLVSGKEELWKSLALHEANDGRLVAITERTYKENPDFSLPSELQSHITLIRQTDRPEWIPLWTPEAAIEIILSQPKPQQFSELMLQLIAKAPENLSNQKLLERLKTTAWLNSTTGTAIAPSKVVLFHSRLQPLGQKLEQLFHTKDSPYVSRGMLGVQATQEALDCICPTWYENDALEFLLTKTQQPSRQVLLILSLIKLFEQKKQTISNDNVERLKTITWLVDRKGQPRSPQQVVHLPALELRATAILEQLTSWNYVTPGMLRSDLDIRSCLEDHKLKDLFVSSESAIKLIGNAIIQLPEYYLGELPITETLLERFIQVFHNCKLMPVLSLEEGTSKDEFKDLILPQVLKPIRDPERLCNILNWLTTTHLTPQLAVEEVYNHYLKTACSQETFGAAILPRIKLLNQMMQWQSPDKLCDGKQFTGIDPTSVLNSSQQEILNSWLKQTSTTISLQSASSSASSASADALEANAQQLREYFHPWLPYLPSEEIGGFLCLIAGTDTNIQQLAQSYLQSRSFDGFRERLLWSDDLKEQDFTIKIQPPENCLQTVKNLVGNSFEARIRQNEVPDHLFVGQCDLLAAELTLIKFSPLDSKSLSKVLLNSAKFLIERVYQTTINEPLDDVWQDLKDSQRFYVDSARDYIFKHLSLILRMLGVQNQDIKGHLGKIDKFDHELHELELRSDARVRGRQRQVSKSLQEAKEDLTQLIEDNRNVNVTADILQAVRKKIGQGQYGYSVASIPFELFQNADDSLAELQRILGRNLPERSRYVLNWDADCLTIMHWGRPINLTTHPDAPQKNFEDQGFNRDLSKMLNFNISDKTESETGKFGLGFKTVHLISHEPYIISGDLKFTIQAGLLPFALPRHGHQEADEERVRSLSEQLQQAVPEISDGTLISLPLDSDTTVEQIIRDFKSQAALLLVFAKHIKTCQLANASRSIETLSWNPATVLGISGIEYGTIRIPNNLGQWQEHKLLRFRLRSGDIAIVLPAKFLQDSSPLKQLPTFWVTAPTKESFNLRFVINGAFDITTGRTSLDRNSKHNRDLMRQLGENLGEQLCELFKLTVANWNSFSEALSLEDTDAYTFWGFLWHVLAVDWLTQNGDSSVAQLLQEGLGGDYCGMGILVASHAALPNGLWKRARQLVRLDRVTHQIEGLLAERTVFEQVAHWKQFNQNYSSDRLVHHTAWQPVKKLLGTESLTPQSLNLMDVLEEELGDCHISPDTATQLGQVITPEKLRIWQISHKSEYDEIQSMLIKKDIYFESEDDRKYISVDQLLIGTYKDSPEEQRLAAFAPGDHLLHLTYTGQALQFFLACRGQRETVSPEKLTAWALNATKETQKQAILDYLVSGERKGVFATQLRVVFMETWMENYPGIRETLDINERQAQAEQASRGEINWNQVPSYPEFKAGSVENEDELIKVAEYGARNPDEVLRSLFRWWQANYQFEIQQYNERLYLFKIEEMQQGLRDRDRSAWLMLLFLGMTHRMGRTTHEQQRSFIQFCIDKGWWERFSNPNPQSSPEEWMSVLNEYMEDQIEETRWYYWIEKFPSLYRISSYLDSYIDSFLCLEKVQHNFNLDLITAPRTNPAFQGGGADAPPLPLGIGANFVLRELLRLEILQPALNDYIPLHCFVPRANVRRFLIYLGCQDLSDPDSHSSRKIYEFLKEKFLGLGLQEEPTFNNCFDIPFELYAKDYSSKLCLHSIHVCDDVGWYKDVSHQEHSQYENFSRGNGEFVTLSGGRVIPAKWMK